MFRALIKLFVYVLMVFHNFEILNTMYNVLITTLYMLVLILGILYFSALQQHFHTRYRVAALERRVNLSTYCIQ